MSPAMPERGTALTAREVDVIRLVAVGMTNQGIGRELYLSTDTVRSHVARMCRRMDAHNRAHLVTRAVERGILVDPAGASAGVRMLRSRVGVLSARVGSAERERDRWRRMHSDAMERIGELTAELHARRATT